MTTPCMDNVHFEAAERRLHDTIVGLVVAVVFVIPATLAAFTLF